jgi:hypothetical protein
LQRQGELSDAPNPQFVSTFDARGPPAARTARSSACGSPAWPCGDWSASPLAFGWIARLRFCSSSRGFGARAPQHRAHAPEPLLGQTAPPRGSSGFALALPEGRPKRVVTLAPLGSPPARQGHLQTASACGLEMKDGVNQE